MSTYFFLNLIMRGYEGSIQRWNKDVDIFTFQALLCAWWKCRFNATGNSFAPPFLGFDLERPFRRTCKVDVTPTT